MSEANKAVVRRWLEEGFNKNDLSVVDETFAEDRGGEWEGGPRERSRASPYPWG